MDTAADHVAGLVRQADPDRYLSTLYAPAPKRPALFALYAFNAEIAAIRDRIREPLPGEIRLQWWRDAITASDSGEAAANPVMAELGRAISDHELPKAALERSLDARIFDLYDDPMPSCGELEGYAGETASALIQLAALALDSEAAPRFAGAAGHAGCAQAIAGLLRLLPLHRARGQCFLPLDILAAVGSSRDEWVSGDASQPNARAFAAMIALAREHLAGFLAPAKALPASLRPAFLPLALVPAYLAGLERAGHAAGKPFDLPGWRRHWLLFRHASRGWA